MALDQEKLNRFRIQREHLGVMLSQASEVVSNLNMTTASENLGQLSQKVNNDTFKIQVVGTFSNGKSTVINSLLGEEVLPAYALPTTAVINEVKYGEKKEAILHFRNPLPEVLPSSLSPKAMEHMKKYGMKDIPPLHINYNEIEDFVVIHMGENPQEMLMESPYEKVELFWPLPMLEEGVEIIDSPGLNETTTRARVTINYLSKADAILFVLAADHLCSMDEMEFIENNLYAYGFTDSFFVVNRFDLIKPQEKERVKQFAELRLGKFTTNPIYYISAQDALKGTIADDHDLVASSGIIPFVTHLTEFLTKNKGNIKLSQPARELKRILNNEALYKVIPGQRTMLESSLDDVRARYEKTKPQLDILKQKKEQVIAKLRLRIEQSKHDFKQAVNHNALAVAGMIPGWIEAYEPKASLGLVPTKSKISAVVVEISDYVNKKIIEQQKSWREEVMIPLVNEKSTYIFDSSEQDLTKLYEEIDDISIQVSENKDIEPQKVPVWQRIAGAAGGLLIGCPDIAVAAGMNGINKELIKNVALVLGTEAVLGLFLGFTDPFVLVGGIIAAILGGGFSGKAAMNSLKTKLSDEFVKSISKNADANSSQIVGSIGDKFTEISSNISKAIDNDINQVEQQVKGIIAEMNKGKANVEARKEMLTSCEAKITELSTELDAFTFELIEQ